tara:strand:- start:5434 stop:6924 length:1491 start_codon:yes stop_codon:yes gene_type:complete
MQFKWLSVCAIFCLLGLHREAFGTLTVATEAPFVINSSNNLFMPGGENQVLSGGFANTRAGYRVHDFLASTFNANVDSDDYIIFDITPGGSYTVSGSEQLILMVAVNSGINPIPIYAAETYVTGTTPPSRSELDICSNGINCQGVVTETISGNTNNYFMAAKMTAGQSIRIAVLSEDICAFAGEKHSLTPLTGCEASGTTYIAKKDDPNGIGLTFYVGVENNSDNYFGDTLSSSTTDDQGNALESQSSVINLKFENTVAAMTCSFAATDTELYFPGDGAINVNASFFKNDTTISEGIADIETIVVVGAQGAAGTIPSVSDSTTFSSYSIYQTGELSLEKMKVSGFTNSTSEGLVSHDVAFGVMSESGIVTNIDGSCVVNGVQTADIQGFLNSGNCFIATASFQSTDATPVVFLRKFRDQFLLKFSFGKEMIRFYYKHSPGAARWLMKRPYLRGIALVFLLPIEIFAWFLLHPLSVIIGFMGTLFLMIYFKRKHRFE